MRTTYATEAQNDAKVTKLRVITINCCLLLPGMCNATLALEMALAQILGIVLMFYGYFRLLSGFSLLLHLLLSPVPLYLGFAVGSHGWLLLIAPIRWCLLAGRNPSFETYLSKLLRVNDYKSERIAALEAYLSDFDVVCCQEVFTSWWSTKYRDMLIQAGQRAGLEHNARSASRGPKLPQILCGDGLLIMSRYPVEAAATEYYTGHRSMPLFDVWHTTRGALYARIRAGGSLVHVFTTHFSPSDDEVRNRVPLLNLLCPLCHKGNSQVAQARLLCKFIKRCTTRRRVSVADGTAKAFANELATCGVDDGLDESLCSDILFNGGERGLSESSLSYDAGDGDASEDSPLQPPPIIVAGDFNFALPSAWGGPTHPPATAKSAGYARLIEGFAELGIHDYCEQNEGGWLPSFGHMDKAGHQAERLLTHPHLWGRHVTEDLVFGSVSGCRARVEELEVDEVFARNGISHVSDHFGIAADVPLL
eukprot:TRINITY_DN32845_c0_g1_i1.p1 TRINITY_DN32845_c0_g1~~TRINITY_DN32845_c0_g1_i1.p1  ORF type:complete len:505 (+),score=89.35 TRINITY_DN32845_c0_g1_i1:84-1517(+)